MRWRSAKVGWSLSAASSAGPPISTIEIPIGQRSTLFSFVPPSGRLPRLATSRSFSACVSLSVFSGLCCCHDTRDDNPRSAPAGLHKQAALLHAEESETDCRSAGRYSRNGDTASFPLHVTCKGGRPDSAWTSRAPQALVCPWSVRPWSPQVHALVFS